MRPQNLPQIDDSYHLTKKDIGRYQRDGHIMLASMAKEHEIGFFQPIVKRLVKKNAIHRNANPKSFVQVMNAWTTERRLVPFVMARRFAHTAARLLGVKAVRLYHDKVAYKDPKDLPTPWHQDNYWIPLDKIIVMWMPLIDVDESMGTLTYASKSDREWDIEAQPIDLFLEADFEKKLVAEKYGLVSYNKLRAGDAIFHSGGIFHKAGPNKTKKIREVISIFYMDAESKVKIPTNRFQQMDLEWWLPGLRAGDLAATHLNPVL